MNWRRRAAHVEERARANVREAAFHEAAHALMGLRCGQRLEFIRIRGGGGSTSGLCRFERSSPSSPDQELRIVLAGVAADELTAGNAYTCQGDLERARHLLEFFPSEQRAAAFDRAFAAAQLHVREYRSEIEAVAQALLARGMLSGAEVENILKRTAFGQGFLTRRPEQELPLLRYPPPPPKPALKQTVIKRGSRLLGTIVKLADGRFCAFEADGMQLGVFATRARATDAVDRNAY